MDAIEEQKQEIEILESIYPDELTILSHNKFTILLKLDTACERTHRVLLHVTYPPEYPEVAPGLDITVAESEVGEEEEYSADDSDSDSDEKPVDVPETIFYEDEDIDKLLALIVEEAELNIGMPSIFALSSVLKDQAEILFNEKLAKEQKKYDEALLAREREDSKKFLGTKVTVDSFNEWRLKFRKEMRINELDAKRLEDMHHGKLTGREIFEKGLGGDFDAEIDDLNVDFNKIEVK